MRQLPLILLLATTAALPQNPGIITTVAGTGVAGFSGDGGPAVQAQFDLGVSLDLGLEEYAHIAVDAEGSLYIPDQLNNRVRKVGPDGIITTIAGTGQYGFAGNNVPALQANLGYPTAVLVDTA